MALKDRSSRLAYALAATTALGTALPAPLTAQPAGDQRGVIEEITVTARKREESLFEIPVSVSAFSQSQLDNAGIGNPEDLADYAAGFDFVVNTGTQGRTSPDIRFRGQVQQVNTPSTQIGAVFWDGSYMAAGSGFVPFGDLERVEVIKGPQTAYFGRNTFSGAINYIPKMPGDQWEGKAEVGYSPSQRDDVKVSGAVGGPITDKVGMRVWAGYDRQGGDFQYGDGSPAGRSIDTSLSGTFTMNPLDGLRLKATGYYVEAKDTGGIGGILATTPAGQCRQTISGNYANVLTGAKTPFTRDLSTLAIASFCGTIPRGDNIIFPVTRVPTAANIAGTPAQQAAALLPLTQLNPFMAKYDLVKLPYKAGFGGNSRTKRIQGSVGYDLPGEHVFDMKISRAHTATTNVQDQLFGTGLAGTTRVVSPGATSRYVRETYIEARVSSPQDGRLRYLFGASDYFQRFRQGAGPVANTLDFQNNSTLGIFASVDYDITEDLTFSAEGRYAHEKSKVLVNGNPAIACGNVTVCNLADSDKAIIPRVIVTYRPFAGATVYGSYSTGSLLGVQTQAAFINSVAPNVIPDPTAFGVFTPTQKNTTYEVGYKQKEDWWSVTLATYFTDWKNQPFASVVILPVGSSSFRGPGSSESWGVDLEASAEPTPWLSINSSLGWVDAKLTDYLSRGSVETAILNSGNLSVDNSGNKPRYVPEWSASFGPTVHGTVLDRAWYVRADVLYESGFFVDFSQVDYNPGAIKVNARAGIDVVPGTNLEVYITNLTNNKRLPTGSTTPGPGGNRIVFTESYLKREVGIRVRSNF
jgi:iron complex outermembrane recepter protein